MEMRKQYQQTLHDLLETNDKVVMMDADLVSASGTNSNYQDYEARCINAGISEANMISSAAGMSRTGMIPYVHTFAPFATRRVLDQVYMSGVYSHNRVHIFGSDPGYWAQHNGGTHTTYEDIAQMIALPQITVTAPCDPVQFDWILREFLNHQGIFYTRAARKELPSIYAEGTVFELGKVVEHGEGTDGIIFAIGVMVHEALEAQQILSKEGLQVKVVDCFSLKPFDVAGVLRLVNTTQCVITAENHSRYGGLGSLVASIMAEANTNAQLKMIAVNDQFGEVGTADYLKEKHGLTAEKICAAIRTTQK